MRVILARSATVVLLATTAACNDAKSGGAESLAFHTLPRWTVHPEASIDGEFGRIAALAVDSRGRVYVADRMRQQIDVYGPGAGHLSTLGRRGAGPGEFLGLTDLAVGRADTLFVLDVQSQRVSMFSPEGGWPLVGTVDLRRGASRANYQILAPAAGGIVVPYTVPATEENLDTERRMTFLHLSGEGYRESRDIIELPEREFLVSRDPRFGFAIGSLPYGRQPFVRLGPGDEVYYAWSGEFQVRRYGLDGRERGVASVSVPQVAVSDDDVRALLDSYGTDPFAQIARSQLQQAHGENRLPATRPALRNMLVDDEGRVWANVVTADDVMRTTAAGMAYGGRTPDAMSRWVVLGADGVPAAGLELPAGIVLRAVRGQNAWGVSTDEFGVERVVRLAVRR